MCFALLVPSQKLATTHYSPSELSPAFFLSFTPPSLWRGKLHTRVTAIRGRDGASGLARFLLSAILNQGGRDTPTTAKQSVDFAARAAEDRRHGYTGQKKKNGRHNKLSSAEAIKSG